MVLTYRIFCLTFLILFINTKVNAQSIPQSGLVASYSFNGNANDATSFGNNGILGGNNLPFLTTDRFGNINSAYQLGGCGNLNWIRVPNSPSLMFNKRMSVSLWFKQCDFAGMDGWGSCVNYGGWKILYAKAGDAYAANPGFYCGTTINSSGKITVFNRNKNCWNNCTLNFDSDTSLTCVDTCEWIHLVNVIDSNIWKMYFNGNLVKQKNITPADFNQANNQDLYFGRMYPGNWYPFGGTIDDVNIYNLALNQQQIDSLYGNYLNTKNVNIFPSSAEICLGSSVNLIANNAVSYGWNSDPSLNTISGNSVIASPTISTNYILNYIDSNGCAGSVIKSVIVVNPIINTINYSICQGQSFQGYSNQGVYIDTFASLNGCDSIRILNLTIVPISISTNFETICSNQLPYTWNGQILNSSGGYTFTTTSSSGCDSIATLNLSVNFASSSSDSDTTCNSYTWPVNNQTYTTSGIYIASSTNSNGCPHTDSLFLTINNNTSSSTIQTSCNSYTWSVNNQTYYSSGIYTVTSTNANGCLHTDSLLLTINNVTSSSSTVVACDSYTWPTNNQTYTSSGIYTSITMNTNGCTQTDSLILTINYSTTTSTSQTACNSFTWPPNNQTYTTGGIYIASSTNTSGCPHTDSLILTVNNSTSTTTTQTACDSFFWSVSGLNYTSSGNYVVTSMNTNNCAHTDSLFLTIHASSSSSQNAIACDSLLWNGINYSLSGNYNALFANIYGCDSLAVLNLTVNYSTYSIDTLTACDSTFWQGSYYFNSGVYYDTLLNALGCDSILQLNLTIHNSTSDTSSEVACDSLLWNGNIYTTTGTFTGQFTNVAGCDSLHTLLLTINHSTTGSSVISNCDQYAWNQQTYTQSGTYSGLFTNSSNCDSTHVLTLTILTSSIGTSDTIVCDSLVWNGTVYTQSGTYTNLFTNAVGCDSTHSLLLEIHPSTSHSIDTSACDQFLWQVNQTEYQTSGNYEVISTDAYGCSHSEQLALTILESDSLHIHQNICTGETYHGYQTPGNYIETYINQYGCDSVVFIHLTSDVKSCCDHYFPNAFSPNGDGLNDEFNVLGEHDYESYELEIYSRWGQLLFTTKNSEIGWDGKWKMEPCDMGTYFYLAKIKCSGKKEIIEKGDLILVR